MGNFSRVGLLALLGSALLSAVGVHAMGKQGFMGVHSAGAPELMHLEHELAEINTEEQAAAAHPTEQESPEQQQAAEAAKRASADESDFFVGDATLSADEQQELTSLHMLDSDLDADAESFEAADSASEREQSIREHDQKPTDKKSIEKEWEQSSRKASKSMSDHMDKWIKDVSYDYLKAPLCIGFSAFL